MNVNWSGLGEVFGIALLAGVGVVVLFSLGIMSLGRREQGGSATAVSTVVAGGCFLLCLGIVGYGIYLVVAR
jgi:hypothetical protein